jgi:hypothetical protein
VVSITRLRAKVGRVANCRVKLTVLRPGPAVLIVLFLRLKVGDDGVDVEEWAI